jgi:hypothetical protein
VGSRASGVCRRSAALGLVMLIAGCASTRSPPSRPPEAAGGGRTAAGEQYVATVERSGARARATSGAFTFHASCAVAISITAREPDALTACLSSGGARRGPNVICTRGKVIIIAQTLPDANSVRLLLRDGRAFSSGVLTTSDLEKSVGGIYYQVLPAALGTPVSFTEVGTRGQVIRAVALPRRSGSKEACVRP